MSEKKSEKKRTLRRLKRPLEQAVTNGFIKNVSTYANLVVNGMGKRMAKSKMKEKKTERKEKVDELKSAAKKVKAQESAAGAKKFSAAATYHRRDAPEVKVNPTRISKDSFRHVRMFANRLIRNIIYSSTASVVFNGQKTTRPENIALALQQQNRTVAVDVTKMKKYKLFGQKQPFERFFRLVATKYKIEMEARREVKGSGKIVSARDLVKVEGPERNTTRTKYFPQYAKGKAPAGGKDVQGSKAQWDAMVANEAKYSQVEEDEGEEAANALDEQIVSDAAEVRKINEAVERKKSRKTKSENRKATKLTNKYFNQLTKKDIELLNSTEKGKEKLARLEAEWEELKSATDDASKAKVAAAEAAKARAEKRADTRTARQIQIWGESRERPGEPAKPGEESKGGSVELRAYYEEKKKARSAMMRFSPEAVMFLQMVVENSVVEVLISASRHASYARRVTVLPKDIDMAIKGMPKGSSAVFLPRAYDVKARGRARTKDLRHYISTIFKEMVTDEKKKEAWIQMITEGREKKKVKRAEREKKAAEKAAKEGKTVKTKKVRVKPDLASKKKPIFILGSTASRMVDQLSTIFVNRVCEVASDLVSIKGPKGQRTLSLSAVQHAITIVIGRNPRPYARGRRGEVAALLDRAAATEREANDLEKTLAEAKDKKSLITKIQKIRTQAAAERKDALSTGISPLTSEIEAKAQDVLTKVYVNMKDREGARKKAAAGGAEARKAVRESGTDEEKQKQKDTDAKKRKEAREAKTVAIQKAVLDAFAGEFKGSGTTAERFKELKDYYLKTGKGKPAKGEEKEAPSKAASDAAAKARRRKYKEAYKAAQAQYRKTDQVVSGLTIRIPRIHKLMRHCVPKEYRISRLAPVLMATAVEVIVRRIFSLSLYTLATEDMSTLSYSHVAWAISSRASLRMIFGDVEAANLGRIRDVNSQVYLSRNKMTKRGGKRKKKAESKAEEKAPAEEEEEAGEEEDDEAGKKHRKGKKTKPATKKAPPKSPAKAKPKKKTV